MDLPKVALKKSTNNLSEVILVFEVLSRDKNFSRNAQKILHQIPRKKKTGQILEHENPRHILGGWGATNSCCFFPAISASSAMGTL